MSFLSTKRSVAVSAMQVRNLRSGVSRAAIVTLGELYAGVQKGMDQELEATVKVLLHKASDSNAFIRQDVDAALNSMVQNCNPTRSTNVLLTGGLGYDTKRLGSGGVSIHPPIHHLFLSSNSHLNAVVRKCTAQHLATLVEKMGAARVLSGGKDLTDRILPAICKLARDSSQETRLDHARLFSCCLVHLVI